MQQNHEVYDEAQDLETLEREVANVLRCGTAKTVTQTE